jgi:putative pyruvate formate lyase activating enzyme
MWRLLRPDAAAVVKDRQVRRSLGRYLDVVDNEKPAKFMIAKKIPAQFSHNDSTEKLWKEHSHLLQEFSRVEKEIDGHQRSLQEMVKPEKSFLDLKTEIANRILSSCHLCSRRCKVNRLQGELGYCRCGAAITVSSIFKHMGEEPELVPSGTIFTMGCTMRCKHCQNYTISQWIENGEACTPEDLAKEVNRLRLNGCRNINLVGGEPTPWLHQWLETFKGVNMNVPVVWNSNSYYSPETALLLAGFGDVYLLDFKYGPGECAERISDAPQFWDVCKHNHLEAKKYGELIVRILVLPNHLDCCAKPIINWIAENLGTETRVNVMFQYRPEWRACEVPELCRSLNHAEMDNAVQLAKRAALTNFIT